MNLTQKSDLCQAFYEDFSDEKLVNPCGICLATGTHCLGGSHPRGSRKRKNESPSPPARKTKTSEMSPSLPSILLLDQLKTFVTDCIQESNIELFINESTFNVNTVTGMATKNYLRFACEHLNIDNENLVRDGALCNSMNKVESMVHDYLSTQLSGLNAEDTSKDNKMYRTFLLPRARRDKANIFTFSARPDLTYRYGPMTLEVKIDTGTLLQVLERIYVLRCTAGFYRKNVCFGANKKGGWVAVYSRTFPTRGGKNEFIRVFSIPLDYVLPLWKAVVSSMPSFGDWLTADGPLLVATLQELRIDHRTCIVRLVGQSSSRVYAVSLLSKLKHASTPLCAGATALRGDFCIKVSHDLQRFQVESTALQAISSEHIKAGIPFYAYAAYRIIESTEYVRSFGTPLDDLELIARAHSVRHAIHRSKSAFLPGSKNEFLVHNFASQSVSSPAPSPLSCFSIEGSGGIIVMRYGIPAPLNTKSDAVLWLNGVGKSLACTHKAGYLHCDLREPNVMQFNDGKVDDIQLIDYDLAVPARQGTVTIRSGGAQWKYAGARVAALCALAINTDHIERESKGTESSDFESAGFEIVTEEMETKEALDVPVNEAATMLLNLVDAPLDAMEVASGTETKTQEAEKTEQAEEVEAEAADEEFDLEEAEIELEELEETGIAELEAITAKAAAAPGEGKGKKGDFVEVTVDWTTADDWEMAAMVVALKLPE